MRSLPLLVFTLVGCVTTHSGPVHELKDSRLNVSCAPNPAVDSDRFKLITCAFENVGDDWTNVSVDSVKVADAKVSTPEETVAFAEAWSNQAKQDRYNTDLALAGAMVGGLVLAIAGGSSQVSGAGLGIASGAALTSAGRDVRDEYREAQYGRSYGADHMMGGAMRIPPEGFVRRSVLLEQKKGQTTLGRTIDLCLKQSTTSCITVDFPQTAQR